MKHSILSLMAILLVATLVGTASPGSRAAESGDRGFASVSVPEMTQAERFFVGELGCEPIGPGSDTRQPSSLLLVCARGSVVELTTAAPGKRPGHGHDRIELLSDDPAGTASSLQRKGAATIGQQHRLASGQLAVELTAPWGLRVELISSNGDGRIAGP